MRFNKFLTKSRNIFRSKHYIYISIVFFAISYINDAKADLVYSSASQAKSKTSIHLKVFDQSNFTKFLEPKSIFHSVNAKELSLYDFRGKFVVLFFWATWCNNCVERLKSLYELEDELKYQNINDIVILPMSVDFKDVKAINEFLEGNKIKINHFYKDTNKELMSALGVKNLPTTILIDKRGFVVNKFIGDFNWNEPEVIGKLVELKGEEIIVDQNNSEKVDETKESSDIMKQDKPIIIN